MLILIRYNASRFPRVVSLQGGATKSFQHDRKVLELDEYDAMRLLRNNSRITPTKWEFSIVGVKNIDKAWLDAQMPYSPSAPVEVNKEESPVEDSHKPEPKNKRSRKQ